MSLTSCPVGLTNVMSQLLFFTEAMSLFRASALLTQVWFGGVVTLLGGSGLWGRLTPSPACVLRLVSAAVSPAGSRRHQTGAGLQTDGSNVREGCDAATVLTGKVEELLGPGDRGEVGGGEERDRKFGSWLHVTTNMRGSHGTDLNFVVSCVSTIHPNNIEPKGLKDDL